MAKKRKTHDQQICMFDQGLFSPGKQTAKNTNLPEIKEEIDQTTSLIRSTKSDKNVFSEDFKAKENYILFAKVLPYTFTLIVGTFICMIGIIGAKNYNISITSSFPVINFGKYQLDKYFTQHAAFGFWGITSILLSCIALLLILFTFQKYRKAGSSRYELRIYDHYSAEIINYTIFLIASCIPIINVAVTYSLAGQDIYFLLWYDGLGQNPWTAKVEPKI